MDYQLIYYFSSVKNKNQHRTLLYVVEFSIFI
jgi:hypothetical protein